MNTNSEEAGGGKLLILAGPSCVGKSPLWKAVQRLYPERARALRPVVLYNSRAPRPGESDGVDYHFRQRDEIENLREHGRYVVLEVRGDLQALDIEELRGVLRSGDCLFEGNPFVGHLLATEERLAEVPRLSVFMSPLGREEILDLRARDDVDLEEMVQEMMRRKLVKRMTIQKGELGQEDLDEIERRSGSAFRELQMAHDFDWVITNHDGEGSDNWTLAPVPIGDAGRALKAFLDLLSGERCDWLERWDGSEVSGAGEESGRGSKTEIKV